MGSEPEEKSLFRFLKFVRPYSHLVIIATIAGILRYIIPLMVPWGAKVIIDDFLTGAPGLEHIWELHKLVGILVGLFLFWAFLSFIRLYFTGWTGHHIIFDLRSRLYEHVQRMSLEYFDRRKIGAIVSRMTHDMTACQQLVGVGVTAALMDVSSIVIIAIILLSMHWQLALVSFALIPGYVLLSRNFSKKIHKTSKSVHARMEQMSGHLYERLSGIALIQAFNRESEDKHYFDRGSRAYLNSAISNIQIQALGLSATGFLAAIAPLIVLWYGAVCVMGGTLTTGELVAFYAYIGLLYTPVSRLTELNMVIASSFAAMERIFEVFDVYSEVSQKKDAIEVKRVQGRISFKKLEFSYEGKETSRREVLRKVSFDVRAGERVILTGESGVGKSTLIKLLLRFYEVQKGSILIDDFDIRDMTLTSLRNQIAFVPQEPILFSGSIFENVRYGKPGATQKEVIDACRAVHAESFILSLPNGYQTQVGERGGKLSAGQRQRIAIARAYLKDAPILVLDEPTSALDPASTEAVLEGLAEIQKGRTCLMIAHRLDSFQKGSRIIYLSQGAAYERRSEYVSSVKIG